MPRTIAVYAYLSPDRRREIGRVTLRDGAAVIMGFAPAVRDEFEREGILIHKTDERVFPSDGDKFLDALFVYYHGGRVRPEELKDA